jgi:hypothetical protein
LDQGPDCATSTDFADDDGFQLRELDRPILELHHQGYSSRKISAILTTEGMPLTGVSVCSHLREMRLDPSNGVRTDSNNIRKSKTDGKWYKIIEWVKNHAEQYERRNGFKISLRTAYYDAIDAGLVKDNEYNRFDKYAADARIGYIGQDGELCLPELPIDCFADDSRKVIENYDDHNPTKVQQPYDVEDSTEYINDAISELMDAPQYYSGKGGEGSSGRRGGYWYGQPEYVEIWQEKTDLMPGFEKILKGVHVNIRGNKGYSSLTFLHRCIQELKGLMERKGLEPDDVWILYCGDWDPSGEDIDYYIQRRLRQLGIIGVHFVRVAVTPEQIEKYRLPLLPIEKKKGKGKPNPLMKEFIRRHGEKATHLNAFFSEEHLPTFKEILLDAINEHWDQSIYDQMVEKYEVYPDEPPELEEEELRKRRRNQYRIITRTFSDPNWFNGLPDAPDPGDMDFEPEDEDQNFYYEDEEDLD